VLIGEGAFLRCYIQKPLFCIQWGGLRRRWLLCQCWLVSGICQFQCFFAFGLQTWKGNLYTRCFRMWGEALYYYVIGFCVNWRRFGEFLLYHIRLRCNLRSVCRRVSILCQGVVLYILLIRVLFIFLLLYLATIAQN
jgi:hypothetical protein